MLDKLAGKAAVGTQGAGGSIEGDLFDLAAVACEGEIALPLLAASALHPGNGADHLNFAEPVDFADRGAAAVGRSMHRAPEGLKGQGAKLFVGADRRGAALSVGAHVSVEGH